MKLQFDANQPFQLDAVRAAVALFAGQPSGSTPVASPYDPSPSSLQLTETGIGNRQVITNEQWLDNLRAVQREHELPQSEALEPLRNEAGEAIAGFPNFTVEMETGTGKTYVYLRTLFELHHQYGFNKFVIVVPSVAIREGVLKSLRMTHEHLRTLYDYPRVSFTAYESAQVNRLRHFALSDALEILVINIDAFAKDAEAAPGSRRKGNVINQMRETGFKPIEFIQACNPVVVLDEPQNLETDKRKQAIARLNPLCTLRYSATHRDTYNLIYRLDPVRAYERGLVKQISVDSVIDLTSRNQAYIDLEGFNSGARSISAKATIWVNERSGPKKKRVTLKNGDDLYEKSKQRAVYRDGFIVNEIDAHQGVVRFANDVAVRVGVPHGTLTEEVLRLQIEATVRRHFEKARKLEAQGIKVLSVFFIDRVASYRVHQPDGSATLGPFGEWFEAIFEEYRAKEEFAGVYDDLDTAAVHNGYFAQDKRSVSPYRETTSRTKADAEAGAFELIMQDKERLLDQAEPLRFIFSHSALREGWDNPNVFQICTLAESSSEIKKRQEIGRGLRLCVDNAGQRVFDQSLNRLTVIANEAYDDFARQLQTEMEDAGVGFKPEMVRNERDKVTVRLRKGYEADPNFLALWQRIRERTRYRVRYDTEQLVVQAARTVREKMPTLERPRIALSRADLAIGEPGVTARQTGYRTVDVEARFVMPDLLADIQAGTGLSRAAVSDILLKSDRLQDAVNNPQGFVEHVVELVNGVRREVLVDGVEYLNMNGHAYEMRRFEDSDLMEVFASNVKEVKRPEKTLFSHIVIDRDSGPERAFAQECEDNEDVLFFLKLPRWFVIDTPVGPYNPDWALAYRDDATLYFVAETKGDGTGEAPPVNLLRPIEQLKIECGRRHFRNFEEVQFRVVNRVSDLRA